MPRSRSQIEAEIDALQAELAAQPTTLNFETKTRSFSFGLRLDGGLKLDVHRLDGVEFVYSDVPAADVRIVRDYLLALYPKTEEIA